MDTKDLISQLQSKVQALCAENAELRAQNGALTQQNMELRKQNMELRKQLDLAEEQVRELQGQLEAVGERLEELEHSQKGPPSWIKPNKPKREGAKGPRRQRAKEHNHGRKRAVEVTRREEHRLERCPRCQGKLYQEGVAWRREVVDLPAPQPVEVTEHVVYRGYCPCCHAWRYATLPEGAVKVGRRRFGPRLMALIGYLGEVLRLPHEAIRSYLGTLHGVKISVGAIADLRRGLAEKLRPQTEALGAQVRGSGIVHADETGWREDGQNGNVWVFSTPGEQGVRYYLFDRSRGQRVVAGFLGVGFQGVLASDFYGAYNVHRGRHQRCWVHLLRDLHALKEAHPQDEAVQGWARELRALYDRAQAFVRGGEPTQEERQELYLALVRELERLGLRYAREKHPCRALAKRVLRHQDELFQFVLVAGLAADNNLAERSLRPLVVVRKISGGTRSPQGSQTRMTLASVFATLKARGLNPYTECLALIRANS